MNVKYRFEIFMYRQTYDVAMGSPLWSVLANIFVGYYKTKLFLNLQKCILLFRYVDDTFLAHMNSFDINFLYNEITNIHSSLQFTFEKQIYGSLTFLVFFCGKCLTLTIQMYVYRKPNCFCPKSKHLSLISFLIYCAFEVCFETTIHNELENIRKIFGYLGYTFDKVDITIRNTISSLDKPKLFGPEKYQVYLCLPYLVSFVSFLGT